jgi:hypothetical protein
LDFQETGYMVIGYKMGAIETTDGRKWEDNWFSSSIIVNSIGYCTKWSWFICLGITSIDIFHTFKYCASDKLLYIHDLSCTPTSFIRVMVSFVFPPL